LLQLFDCNDLEVLTVEHGVSDQAKLLNNLYDADCRLRWYFVLVQLTKPAKQ
jgi:hypothetical protein